MRRPLTVAITVAGAALAAGLLAGPALAGASTPPGAGPETLARAGTGTAAVGIGADAKSLAGLAQGTLTNAQKVRLAGMAEEEKLAHDVYVKLADTTGDIRFTRISTAETRHHSQIRMLLTRHGVADPTAGRAEGQFTSPSMQRLYGDLVARGSVSLNAALAVGREIETLDIADLAAASEGVTAQDVLTVYDRLSQGSQNHLQAFGG